jgi:sensor domain CHASE-containing protein
MKRLIIMLLAVVAFVIFVCAVITWAGEKEERLQLEYRALVAEFNLAQQRLPQFQALTEFMQQLDKQGYMVKNGQIVENPKPAPKKEEPKKEGGSK